jgi:DNA polymerase-3 subunit alpha
VKYVSLHHHTTFSFMDGYGTPASHVERAAELDMNAIAVTEHGNVSSHPQFEKAAVKAGVQPIFGLEAYTALDPKSQRKFHLTLLAMNELGYSNLMQIVTKSWQDFYYWPTVSGSMLAEHHEGLIVLSGCADSLLACSLLGGKTIATEDASFARASRQAEKFKRLFGDRFYLECQMFPELERTRSINAAYQVLGRQLDIPLVATADVHYPRPDDNEMQVILHAAGRGAGSVAAQEAGWEYDIRLTHPVSDKVALQRMRGTGLDKRAASQALAATAEIAERCSVILPKAARLRYPIAPTDPGAGPGVDSLSLIWDWLARGWRYRVRQGNRSMVENRHAYLTQITHEMEQIQAKGFIDYFLMTSDVVRFAKNNGIPVGPARGSAAASLVCYLLRITEIDPIMFPLMRFDRFIAPDRDDIPDIDLDFDDARRGEVREYALGKYGAERVGNVANYVKYKGKNSLVDVGRVFPRIPKQDIELAKSMIIERSGGDSRADAALEDTVNMFPIVKAVFDKYPDLWKATRLEGNYRGMSINAAGFIIADQPVNEICAQYTREVNHDGEKQVRTVVSVDKKDAEYLGLMKVDFLSLSTMGMIALALKFAGLTLEELYSVPIDDAETMAAFLRNDVIGIFQYEGRATRLVNREVRPSTFMELADINALSRPGPLFSGATADYIDVKHGKKKVEKVHPLWDRLMAPTKGQAIYQEQVLSALGEIGGIPPNRVGQIRRIISQKLGEMQFATHMGDFLKGAKELHGINEKLGTFMWGRLVTSATYSFNVGHCISYAMLAFWCMWLKIHHPEAFYASQLQKTEKEDWPRLIKDAERHGVKVLGVDAAWSQHTWSIRDDKAIVAGWIQLPGIGPSKAKAIMEYREQLRKLRQTMTMDDLPNVKGIGPKMLEGINAMDQADPFGLRRVERILTETRDEIDAGTLPLRRPTHTSDAILDAKPDSTVVFVGLVKLKEYKDWIEDERARTGDDPEDIKRRMRNPHLPTGCVLHCFDDGDEDVYVRIDRMVYPKFKDALEGLRIGHDIILAVARKSRNSFGASIYVKELYVIDPEG